MATVEARQHYSENHWKLHRDLKNSRYKNGQKFEIIKHEALPNPTESISHKLTKRYL